MKTVRRNIYGTRQALSNPYTGVAAVFGSRMLNGNAPLVFEDGEQMRDFVSLHDIVQANMLAMERSKSDGEVINVGCGKPITIRRVAELLAEAFGAKVQPIISNKHGRCGLHRLESCRATALHSRAARAHLR